MVPCLWILWGAMPSEQLGRCNWLKFDERFKSEKRKNYRRVCIKPFSLGFRRLLLRGLQKGRQKLDWIAIIPLVLGQLFPAEVAMVAIGGCGGCGGGE